MSDDLPEGLRARAYGALALLLDLSFIANEFVQADYESMMIFVCAAEATMRPLMQRVETGSSINAAYPPEHLRGSISRLLIADRTGLPRETVRRKTNALVDRGLLFEDSEGRVRCPPTLSDPRVQNAIEEMHAAISRYLANVREAKMNDQV